MLDRECVFTVDLWCDIYYVDFLETDPGVQQLTKKLDQAMGLPEDHRIGFLSLQDSLTSMMAHGKPIPKGIGCMIDVL